MLAIVAMVLSTASVFGQGVQRRNLFPKGFTQERNYRRSFFQGCIGGLFLFAWSLVAEYSPWLSQMLFVTCAIFCYLGIVTILWALLLLSLYTRWRRYDTVLENLCEMCSVCNRVYETCICVVPTVCLRFLGPALLQRGMWLTERLGVGSVRALLTIVLL